MPRRFTGDDDWLDDVEALSRPKAAKKPVQSRAQILQPEEGNSTVTEIFPNQSATRLDGEAQTSLCGYRMSTLAFGLAKRERSPVCVGDRVRVEAGVIVGRCERRNRLIRSAPNVRNPLIHVLAANLDCLVIVAAAREPKFSSGIIDRFLVAASAQKIQQILCINKADLIKPYEARSWSHYPAAGVTVVEVSARSGRGTDRLSALLRRLLADESYGRVGAVSETSDKGRHTTAGAVLLAGPDGSSLIDTPGVMNFGLIDVSRHDLLSHFPELSEAAGSCGADCRHDAEEDCALRRLPRHASYRQILSSL